MIIDKELELLKTLSNKIDIVKHCLWQWQYCRYFNQTQRRTSTRRFLARYKKCRKS